MRIFFICFLFTIIKMSDPPVYLTNFMDNHINDLIQIYIQERMSKGIGALFLEGELEKKNVNVFFVEVNKCPESVYKALTSMDSSSKALFVLIEENDRDKQYIMVHDLDPRNNTNLITKHNEFKGIPELEEEN